MSSQAAPDKVAFLDMNWVEPEISVEQDRHRGCVYASDMQWVVPKKYAGDLVSSGVIPSLLIAILTLSVADTSERATGRALTDPLIGEFVILRVNINLGCGKGAAFLATVTNIFRWLLPTV